MTNEKTDHRVVMVAAGSCVGGDLKTSHLVLRQVVDLEKNGWDVTLGLIDSRISPAGILRNLRKLRRLINEIDPAVVHAQYGSMVGYIARRASRGRPFVVSFCGDDLLGTPNPGWVWRCRERLARELSIAAAKAAAAIIVKSRNLAGAVPSGLRAKIHVVPNGVPVEEFHTSDAKRLREELGWSQQRTVLFNASWNENSHVKNPVLARKAVELARKRMPDIQLVEMTDFTIVEVVKRMNAAECLLVTSLHEGSPNVVKEAMACNLPVVSVDCGDVAERLQDTVPGAVCEYQAEELADAILTVMSTQSRSNGREQIIMQGLSSPDIAHRLCEIYEASL